MIVAVHEVSTSVQDIYRLDAQLQKHVQELEEFESQSKQNRQRLLTGNSKALVEEEKFRKSSKRKYEVVTEKISQTISAIQHIGAMIDVDGLTVDVSQLAQHLSPQGVDILLGKMQDKIELMHLHTSTHGIKKSSSDDASVTDIEKEKQQSLESVLRSSLKSNIRPATSGRAGTQAKIASQAVPAVFTEVKTKLSKLSGHQQGSSSTRINGENVPNRSNPNRYKA